MKYFASIFLLKRICLVSFAVNQAVGAGQISTTQQAKHRSGGISFFARRIFWKSIKEKYREIIKPQTLLKAGLNGIIET
ncbi:hypothetical protein [Campylobacter showae]|uniref:hypothetical protein n=1 Tax=Campylobacter showae TaxID=204 RepID=UPI003C6F6326